MFHWSDTARSMEEPHRHDERGAGRDCCDCKSANREVHQTIDEMEFERGIWTAALQNDLERVDTFIRKGKKNATDNFGYTALHFACRAGHVQVAELLLRNGVDVESRTRSGGVTSLQKAASGGRLEVVRLLVEDWGADVRAQDVDGKTGLHKATEGSYAAVVKYFLERDRTLMDVADHRYETPFALAERMKGNSGAGEEVWKLFERDVGL